MRIKPEFFDRFSCKASACRHTCCAGWEICIDDETAGRYETLLTDDERQKLGKMPDRLLCREGERCVFLRPDRLCGLIISHGEGALCEICREHPRFYSYSEDGGICEAGVGLCCEEGARLWLGTDPVFICEDDGFEASDDEAAALRTQQKLIKRALSGEFPTLDYAGLTNVYRRLETLEPLDFPEEPPVIPPLNAGRLAAYYIYRWYFEYPDAAEYFAAANAIMTSALGGDFADSARKLSCEAEYDPDNTELIIDYLRTLKAAGH